MMTGMKYLEFDFENVKISIKRERNKSLSGKELRKSYIDLLLYRDNLEVSEKAIITTLKALFTKNFNIRSKNSFKKELHKLGAMMNYDSFYRILRNDKNNNIITKKMLEE